MLYDKKWEKQLPVDSFLSPEALQITQQEHAALQQVLRMLESGEISDLNPDKDVRYQFVRKGLWMATSSATTACGTTACIGGWVAAFMKVGMDTYVFRYHENSIEADSPLHELYWGNIEETTTTKQAAQAIRNFLTTSNPDWKTVLRS